MACRCASHAGSWYTDQPGTLHGQLGNWLRNAGDGGAKGPQYGAKAIIAPHAGYSYSGPTAAWAYGNVDASRYNRIFILGPSHHYYLPGCALSRCDVYETPIGALPVDRKVCEELAKTGAFDVMTKTQDEEEHSIEMHLPYVAKLMDGRQGSFTVVPVLVGSIDIEEEKAYAGILQPYFDDPNTLFIISSDFCHWGRRFSFQYHDEQTFGGDIYKSIEWLDHQGMALIEQQDAKGFNEYLKRYKNTICGRHPIGVLLQLLDGSSACKYSVKFTKYAQSSQCRTGSDSSVSYASACVNEAQ
jgi:MEMO1 family protein|eukprot:g8759.t1